MIINGDENSTATEEDVGPYIEGQASVANNGQPYTYIAGIVETSDISDYPYPYIVGDGSRSSIGGVNYENVQLQPNVMYAILVRAYTSDDMVSKMYLIVFIMSTCITDSVSQIIKSVSNQSQY